MRLPRERTTWLLVFVFAVAMAWVEAAAVHYLRVLVDRVDPYQANPLPIHGVLSQVELVREPGSGKSAVLSFIYPNTYKKNLYNKFFDLYDPKIHDHVMLEDLDHDLWTSFRQTSSKLCAMSLGFLSTKSIRRHNWLVHNYPGNK